MLCSAGVLMVEQESYKSTILTNQLMWLEGTKAS